MSEQESSAEEATKEVNGEFNPLKLFASSALSIEKIDCVILAAAGDNGAIKLMATGSNLNLLGLARYMESSFLKELLGGNTETEKG